MNGFRSVRRFISTKEWPYISNWYVPVAIIAAFVLIIGYRIVIGGLYPGQKQSQSSNIDEDRQLILVKAELEAAQSKNVYMMLDLTEAQLQLRQGGVTVWSAPLKIAADDSLRLTDFAAKLTFNNSTSIREIDRTHLYRSSPVVSDTVLAIVGDAVNIAPDKLKRHIPEHLAICWDEGLCLDIRTDTPGRPNSVPGNIEESIRESLGDWLGGAILTIRLTGNQAMALYGACKPGMVTIIKT